MKNTFHKNERLSGKKAIDELFEKGKPRAQYPIKMMYLISENREGSVRAMFVAPKKKFKKAPDRNKLKRRMREAYRVQKRVLSSRSNGDSTALHIAFIYIAPEIMDHKTISAAMEKLLNSLSEQIVPKTDVLK